MIFLKDLNGCILNAPSALDAVIQMRDEGRFTRHQSVAEYMKDFANRIILWNNKIVRTDSCQNFLDDLIEIGYFKVQAPCEKPQTRNRIAQID